MFEGMYGMLFGGMGGMGDFDVDRRGWKDKSNAAERREDEAKKCFLEFLERTTTSYSCNLF
jgi:hypothetical protein